MPDSSRILVALVAALAACAPAPDRLDAARSALPLTSLTTVESPAGPFSGEPNLAVDHRGRVYMSWLQRTADSAVALRLAVRDGDTWQPAMTLTERKDLFVNWADFPSVYVAPSGRIVTHWLQRSGGGRYSYDIMVRQSSDGGASWSEPRVMHDDGVPAEHGFLTFFEAEGDSVEAIWLDGRATAGGHDGHRGAMQLGNGRIAADGGISHTSLVDDRICDCCQTSAAVTARGPIVVYRDRSPDEIRDIAVIRRVNGAWTAPVPVHADNWHIEGCPVNGPSVVADGDLVAVAWFTGARDSARVNVAFSSDAGASFGDPIRVDDGNPVGRVDAELDGDGRALVTWLERVGDDGAEVRIRALSPDGTSSPSSVVASSAAARSSGFPRVVRSGSQLFIAWTLPGDTSRVKVAVGQLSRAGQ